MMNYKVIPVTSFNQNCSLVWCEKTRETVLIDPGEGNDILFNMVTSLSLVMTKILLTHGHIDHVAGAMALSNYYQVPIFGPHYADMWLLNNIKIQCYMLNFSIIPPVIPNFWLIDHEILRVGNFCLEVLHVPGHSPGHVVFWNKQSKFIFMGDVLFRGGVGRTDLPGGNSQELINSIKRLISLGDDISFLPGHGPNSTLGYERIHNVSVKRFM